MCLVWGLKGHSHCKSLFTSIYLRAENQKELKIHLFWFIFLDLYSTSIADFIKFLQHLSKTNLHVASTVFFWWSLIWFKLNSKLWRFMAWTGKYAESESRKSSGVTVSMMIWNPGAISEETTTLKVVTTGWMSLAYSRPDFRMRFLLTIIQSKYVSAKVLFTWNTTYLPTLISRLLDLTWIWRSNGE